MKLTFRQKLALLIAGVADGLDYLLIGAIPELGDFFLDIPVSILNSAILQDPEPMIGLIEAASIIPVLAPIDFIPTHSILAWHTIRRQNKK